MQSGPDQSSAFAPQLFVARQPIFLADRTLAAYELLFRASAVNMFPAEVDPDKASIDIIGHAIGAFGLDALIGPDASAYINVTRRVMVEALYACLPQGRFVLELLESLQPDAELIAACQSAKQAGYGIALDDYIDQPALAGFLPHVDVIKVDFRQATPETRRKIAQRFAGSGVRLLAEKIETEADLKEASELGYTHFQGYFFCKPEMVTRRDLPMSKLVYLQFLTELNRPSLDLARMERVIKQDVALSLKLLRYLKSAAFGWRTEITSIKHALGLLGERPFRRWASVLALAALSSDRPPELLALSLTRARFCELLGAEAGLSSRSLELFLLGLFSLMDAVVQRPLTDLLSEVSLPADLIDALTFGGKPSPMRSVLELAIAYERAQWVRVDQGCEQLSVAPASLPKIYADAVSWAANAASAGG